MTKKITQIESLFVDEMSRWCRIGKANADMTAYGLQDLSVIRMLPHLEKMACTPYASPWGDAKKSFPGS